MVVKIITINARGLNEPLKRRTVFDYYRQRCDILCLQETHCVKDQEQLWTTEWGGRTLYSHGTANSKGVAILVKKNVPIDISQVTKDNEGRWLACNILAESAVFSLTVVYGPNKDCPGFFVDLINKTLHLANKRVLCGDFNVVLNPYIDSNSSNKTKSASAHQLEQIMIDHKLRDTWRTRNPEHKRYSWMRLFPKEQLSRLDFALISEGFDNLVHDIFYLNGIRSDHSALCVILKPTVGDRGKGYWKLNTTLLQDGEYIKRMNEDISIFMNSSTMLSPDVKWERLKQMIKTKTIKFSKNKAADKRVEIGNLAEKITEMEDNINTASVEDKINLEEAKADLNILLNDRAKGVMFRSKCNWVEHGEKNSKYFYALESANYNAKTCTALFDGNGDICYDPDAILKLQEQFYSELYRSDPDIIFDFHEDPPNRVDDAVKQEHENQLTEQELAKALKSMANNKCPGRDGIPADFYKNFWPLIRSSFHEAVIFAFEHERLHTTASRGVLNLIPKQQKDTRVLKNLRPITLLNTDYKIIERALADRIIPQLQEIIHQDQRGFIPNRRISANIRKIIDTLAEGDTQQGIVLQLDIAKAFDKVEMTAITESLRLFNFADLIIKWIQILYKNFKVRVQNNGHFSKLININRSVHQGGPGSAAIFVCIAELLALDIRSNAEVKGIFIEEFESLLNQYADDTDVALDATTDQSINAVLTSLKRFHKATGCAVNYDKTTLYRTSSLKKSDAKKYTELGLSTADDSINVLGVDVAEDAALMLEINYRKLLVKVQTTLKSWSNRSLSVIGKVNIINTLAASKLIHTMSVLPEIPDRFVNLLEKEFEQFIWNNHKPKIPLEVLKADKKSGGLGLVDLKRRDRALKVAWVKLLYEDEQMGSIARARCAPKLGNVIWQLNLNKQDIPVVQRFEKISFWKDVLSAWCDFNYTTDCHRDHRIWLNSLIRVNNKPIYWDFAAKKGLLYVSQLFPGGRRIPEVQALAEYGLSTMQLNSLMDAMPTQMRTYIKECI